MNSFTPFSIPSCICQSLKALDFSLSHAVVYCHSKHHLSSCFGSALACTIHTLHGIIRSAASGALPASRPLGLRLVMA